MSSSSRHTDTGVRLSRRELLRAVVGATATLPVGAALPVRWLTLGARTLPAQAAFETLTATESATLEAIVARLIPSDEHGPGALEAGAAHYIDRALGGALASSRDAYAAGLAAADVYAQAAKGAPFAQLSVEDQDGVLSDMERNIATGFAPRSSTFFNLVRTHTIQGTFCDPYYGGNESFVGWDLIGYPGVRLRVPASEQRIDVAPTPSHRSAYDFAQFSTEGTSRGR